MTEECSLEREIPGPGDIIQYARDQRGLSLLELAEELRISEAKLRSLEANDFEVVGTDTFVRGYFRASARVLKLDADDLMSEYDAYLIAADLIDKSASFTETKKILSPSIIKWLMTAGALLLIAILLALFLPSSSSTESKESQSVVGSAVTDAQKLRSESLAASETLAGNTEQDSQNNPPGGVSEDTLATEDQVQAQSVTPLINNQTGVLSQVSDQETVVNDNTTKPLLTDSGAVASELGSELSSAIASSIAAGEAGSLGDDGNTELSFEFESECWLEVYEADGNRLFSGVKQATDLLVVSGIGPFQVQLGNAAVVNLKVDGQRFDIEKRSGAKTLKFTVPTRLAR